MLFRAQIAWLFFLFTWMGTGLAVANWSAAVQTGMGYDSSLYRVDVGGLGDRSSLYATLRPELGVIVGERLRLRYTGVGHLYFSDHSEDNIRHTVAASLVNVPGLVLTTAQTYVQGSREAVVYDEGRNAFATAAPRERRAQWQNRSRLSYTLGDEQIFARWVGSLLLYDLDTIRKTNVPGYQNWVNRYDFHTGPDLGWKWEDREVYVGYRWGHQYQGRQGGLQSDRSNDYSRVLIGGKGDLVSWLEVDGALGITHIRYTDSQSIGPSEKTMPYLDAGLVFQLSEVDRLRASGSVRNWVGSTGRVSSVYQQYRLHSLRDWTSRFRSDVSIGAFSLKYDGIQREDWMFFAELNLYYQLAEGWDVSLRLRQEEGRDFADSSQSSRDFQRTEAGLFLSKTF